MIQRSSGGFATKPALALTMIERANAAETPFSFVAADRVYGVGDIEMGLRRVGKGYVLGVKANHHFCSWDKPQAVAGTAKVIAESLPETAWRRLSAGAGTKRERLHDWAYLELADLDAGEYDAALTGVFWTRGLFIRRNVATSELAFFTIWAPSGTPIETLVKVEGRRWAIEDSFETAKNELGLDHNETRSWHGWRTPCVARRARPRHDGRDPDPRQRRAAPKNNPKEDAPGRPLKSRPLIRWSIQEIRRIATRLARKRIRPEHVIAWSPWRRAHQAEAKRPHINSKMQL